MNLKNFLLENFQPEQIFWRLFVNQLVNQTRKKLVKNVKIKRNKVIISNFYLFKSIIENENIKSAA